MKNNNKKQTAVMQLIEELGWNKETLWSQKYLELEKQQIVDACGDEKTYLQDDGSWRTITAEQYYNETYGDSK